MKQMRAFLKKWDVNTFALLRLMILSLLTSLLSLVQPEVLRRAIAAITGQDLRMLVWTIVFAAVAAVLFMSLTYCTDVSIRATQNRLEQKFSSLLLKKLTNTKMAKLSKMQFGDVSTAVIRSVESFASSTVDYVLSVSTAYSSLALTFIYMCFVQWQLALCVVVYNLVIRFFAVFVERKMKKNSVELTAAMKESSNELTAQLRNMLMVRIYSNRDFFKKRIEIRENDVRKTSWMRFVWSNGFQDHIWAFSKLAEFIIVYGVGAILIYNGLSDLSVLMTFVFANDLFTIGINNLAASIDAKADAQAHQQNMQNLLEETELEDEVEKEVHDPNGIIEFQNVSFGYGDREILQNVSFSIYPGEHILLQGTNGQGKTTILKLLSGLYRPQSGKILWGGQDIGTINLKGLRESYGYITQHSHMLDGSVVDNLTLTEDNQSAKAKNVLEKLKLSHCIDIEPQHLSMGEQQRLNIGRILYREDCMLLLCDEIFSNVDKDNRQTVANALTESFPRATVVMISHEEVPFRIDRILKVENGSVEEVMA